MKITLKDNVVAEVKTGTTVLSVVNEISESLSKSAICGKISGALVDLTSKISKNCKLEIITMKDKDAINVLWHSCSHILAQAVKTIYPNAKLASGNNHENGFYYDFDFRTPISEADLSVIEDEMQKIIDANFPVVRADITKEQAFMLAEENEEPYKLEIINKLPSNEAVGLYTQGDFFDFCSGPHLKSTGLVKAFKLTHIEKTYWENDPENRKLTRINGVAFFFKKDLDNYLKNQELIAKRNHMILGKSLGLFGKDPMTEKIVFLKSGQRILNSIKGLVGSLADKYGYNEISLLGNDTKNIGLTEATAYRVSNKDSIIFPIKYYISEVAEPKYINLANGLFDQKQITRDKFILFSRLETVETEFKQLFEMVKEFYSAFGFNIGVRLHVGDNGVPEDYTKVKGLLKRAIDKKFGGAEKIQTGYHKLDVLKVEYLLTDNLGREWSLGSLHVDFSYASANGIALTHDGKLEFPLTIISNMCKSNEKLLAILVEHTAGKLPFWLKPTMVKIIATDPKAIKKAKKLSSALTAYKIYNETFLAHKGKIKPDADIPLTVIIGKTELETGQIKVLESTKETTLTSRKFIQEILRCVYNKSLTAPSFN